MPRRSNVEAASASYPSASRFEAAFHAFRHVPPDAPARAPQQFYALGDLETAFRALKTPLTVAKEKAGLVNPWALASLKRDEVRNVAALAGLWMPDFGGLASQRFAGAYLAVALSNVDWSDELGVGYQVSTEVCPLGEGADRVDLVITTTSYLIAGGAIDPNALLFSTEPMVRGYARARHWIEGTLAVVFATAGLKLITAR